MSASNNNPLRRSFFAACAALSLVLAGCATQPPTPASRQPEVQAAFVVTGSGGRAIARVLTAGEQCPSLQIDGAPQAMTVRAMPAVVAPRGSGADSKPAAFEILTCEAELPAGIRRASVEGTELPLPHAEIRRILVIGDTGCRLKRAEQAYQACNDSRDWPFPDVAKAAVAANPDLVIHLGDMHYRESPCPPGNKDCAGSPWGFGYDAWAADFFKPARPLLAAAPWVFVRGNHETCGRAGQGWFRFIDTQPWSLERSCNDPRLDANADFSDPYAIPLDAGTQLLVFDSGKASFLPYRSSQPAWGKYVPQLGKLAALAGQKPHAIFLSHHPVLAFSEPRGKQLVTPGSLGLQSVLQEVFPGRLLPRQTDFAMHGHVHLFEALNFSSDHPATFVLGNSGSAIEGVVPQQLPAGALPAPGTVLQRFFTDTRSGFTTLDRDGEGWILTAWDVQSRPMYRCALKAGKSDCRKLDPA